jgi:hypothetical protein
MKNEPRRHSNLESRRLLFLLWWMCSLKQSDRNTSQMRSPNLSVAQTLYRHCTDKDLVVLVGIGLERSLVPNLLTQLQDDANHGCMLIERVNANTPLERGGKVLGYEPLGFDATKFPSSLCHDAPTDVNDRFGIRPNRGFH